MIDAKDVMGLHEKLRGRYATQLALDNIMLDLYVQKKFLNVKRSETDLAVQPVGTGLGGFLVDQKATVLSGPLFLRVISRGGQKADRHASDRLEPYLNTALRCLEDDQEVRGLIEQDVLLYGRAWSPLLPAPFFWADDEMREMVDKKASADEFEAYMSNNIPIVWRHWDSKAIHPVFNDKGEPARLVYWRQMYADDIVDRWGDVLPARTKSDALIDVIDYVDKKEIGSVITGKEPRLAREPWEHQMGCVPVAYYAGGRLPPNNYGLYWKGALFHARELLHSMDETMTDIRTNIRDFTIAPPVVTVNPDVRGAMQGWPSTVEWKPGNETTINLLTGETVSRFPVSQITIDAYQYLMKAREYLELTSLREGLSGSGPSGQSAVHLTGSNQISKAELQRYLDGLKRGYKKVGELLLRCPAALNAEFGEKYADKIVLRAMDEKHESKEIAVTPADTKDYYKLVVADIDLNLPVNEGAAVQNFSVATQSGGMSKATARERYLNIQNPYEEEDRIQEEALYAGLAAAVQERLLQKAQNVFDRTGSLSDADIIKRASQLPEFAREAAFAALQGGEGSAELGNVARGMNNEARTGRGQRLSELSGNNTGLPEGVP